MNVAFHLSDGLKGADNGDRRGGVYLRPALSPHRAGINPAATVSFGELSHLFLDGHLVSRLLNTITDSNRMDRGQAARYLPKRQLKGSILNLLGGAGVSPV
jgi:hypothetical protein